MVIVGDFCIIFVDVEGEVMYVVLVVLLVVGWVIMFGVLFEWVLTELVGGVRDFVDVCYVVIGIFEFEGDEFARFVIVGMSDELIVCFGLFFCIYGLFDVMLVDLLFYWIVDIM